MIDRFSDLLMGLGIALIGLGFAAAGLALLLAVVSR